MTNDERWTSFIHDLREYILDHHHLPDKHRVENRGLLNQTKYLRKKMKDGTLDAERVQELEAVLSLRSNEHTGGRRKVSHDPSTYSGQA